MNAALQPRAQSVELIRTRGLTKVYRTGAEVIALRDVDLSIARSELVSIIGASGSGKSTLLHILGCLDSPTRGEYWLDGKLVSGLEPDQLADVRNQIIGFVFQSFQLLPRLTALENVMLPLAYDRSGRKRDTPDVRQRAAAALARLGLADRMDHRPAQLSGGQQQRVAIARAIVNDPRLLLADEPTGNLDSATAREILGVFKDLHATGTTVLIITHSRFVAAQTRRVIEIKDGRIVCETTPDRVEILE